MKKWFAALAAAGVLMFGGMGVSHAADWYYIDADADDSAWFIDNSSVYKTDSMARILVKANNTEGYTYIYNVEINRPNQTWTETKTTVYTSTGVPLLSNNEVQKPVKIEKDTIGAEVMQALWGR